jgi:hypothetical protein
VCKDLKTTEVFGVEQYPKSKNIIKIRLALFYPTDTLEFG